MHLVIDGSNMHYIDFEAAGPVKAVGMFVSRWQGMKQRYGFDKVAIAIDSWPSWRVDYYFDYKAGRKEKKPGYWDSFESMLDRSRLAGFDVLEKSRVEADDLMADYARDCVDNGERAVLVSRDKDMFQCLVKGLVTQATEVKREVRGHPLAFTIRATTAEKLFERTGLHPWQWVEYQMIVGDKVDRIPGCVGVGKKWALPVLQQWGTLDRFWSDPDAYKLPKGVRRKLIEFQGDQANLQRLLVTLGDPALRESLILGGQ